MIRIGMDKLWALVFLGLVAGPLFKACTVVNYGIASYQDRPGNYRGVFHVSDVSPFVHDQAIVVTEDGSHSHNQFDGIWVRSSSDSNPYPLYPGFATPQKVTLATSERIGEFYIVGTGYESGITSVLLADNPDGSYRSLPIDSIQSIAIPSYTYFDYEREEEIKTPSRVMDGKDIGDLLLKYGNRWGTDKPGRYYPVHSVKKIQIKHAQVRAMYYLPVGILTDLTIGIIWLLRK